MSKADFMKEAERKFGKGAVVDLGSETLLERIDTISTGSIALDLATGVGGLPRGRITEIYGPASSGKTMLASHAVREAQQLDLPVLYIDAEHALDLPFMHHTIGVNAGLDSERASDAMILAQPSSGEEALSLADMGVDHFGLIVIDSVAALVPRAELAGDIGDAHVGLQARMMGQFMRKIMMRAGRTGCTLIFINQLRAKIGTMGYGPNETTPGGNALPYAASMRLDIRRIESLKQGDQIIGHKVKVKVVKNKVATPYREARFDILYDRGFSNETTILELAVEKGRIKKNGAWFTDTTTGEHIGQGKLSAAETIRTNPELRDELVTLIYGENDDAR